MYCHLKIISNRLRLQIEQEEDKNGLEGRCESGIARMKINCEKSYGGQVRMAVDR